MKSKKIVKLIFGIVFLLAGVAAVAYQHSTQPETPKTAPNRADWADEWTIMEGTGDLVNGPGTFKEVAELPTDSEEVKSKKATFNAVFVDNPFFDCFDDRNQEETWRDMDRFIPCVNGSTWLQLRDGRLKILGTTNDNTRLHDAVVGTPSDVEYHDGDFDLVLRKDGNEYLLGYYYHPVYNPFEFYARVGDGPWELVVNLNDRSWPATATVEFALTWQDPTRPMFDAPLPFEWEDVQKNIYIPIN